MRAVTFGFGVLAVAACGRTPTELAVKQRCSEVGVPALACEDPCASSRWKVEASVPRVLLAVDRSCSMVSRWSSAMQGLRDAVAARGDEVQWGITAFPDRVLGRCEQGELLLPVGPGRDDRIVGLLGEAMNEDDEMYPSGPCVTNIAAGIGQAATDPAFDEVGPHKVLILMTDGWTTCGDADGAQGAVELVQRLHDEIGVSTYVVSFMRDVDQPVLVDLATAGGTVRDGQAPYWVVTENLGAIVDEIVGGLQCAYGLDISGDEVDRVEVTLDGAQPIPRDAYSGWTYDEDARRLTFHGAACDVLQDRGARIDVSLRCG